MAQTEWETNAAVLRDVMKRMRSGEKISRDEFAAFAAAQNAGLTTGPEIGERVPEFALPDQHGNNRSLADLAGPHGLLLAFTRSADW